LHNTVAISVVLKSITDFVAAINSHDVETIAALMADDHTFIDAHGNEVTGKETMKDGWASYFQLFPDYYIEIEEIFTKGDLAMAHGRAGAGTGEKAWEIPAAWRAIVRDEKIKLWQVYADTRIQFEKMAK
jgi:ketosteroid isomerase-like protein